MTTALVISGGGCKGAFAVGAVKWLIERGEKFSFCIGTSTGSLVATLVAGNRLDLAEHIYSTVRTKDLLRKYCFLTLPWRSSIYSTRGLKRVIKKNLTERFFEDIKEKGLNVCTVGLNSGKLFYWTPEQLSLDEFRAALLASCSEPGFMAPVRISDGYRYHLDGGIREVVPVSRAVKLGADRIIVINLSPSGYKWSTDKYNRLVPILTRTLDLMIHETRLNDILLVDDTRLIVIEPDKELTDNSLKFEPEEMKKMIELGYEKAKEVLPNDKKIGF